MSKTNKKITEILTGLRHISENEENREKALKKIISIYANMDLSEKESLFKAIIEEIEAPKEEILPIIKNIDPEKMDSINWSLFLSDLRQRLSSPRLNMLMNISRIPGGLKFLLDLRSDILTIKREFKNVDLRALDRDIVLLFELWFCEGFLYLEEITTESTYKQIEIIKNSDLVHPMTSIEEMIKRLGKDMRCFALYHRLIPYEPIVFIEVALMKGIPRRIDEIINRDTSGQEQVDTAVFYSINNTQNGLAGLGLGKVLIARVMDYLKKEDNRIKNFVTLSPLPGFWEKYLKPILEGKDKPFLLKSEKVEHFFSKKQKMVILKKSGISEDFNRALLHILSRDNWPKDKEIVKALERPMVKIAAHYLFKEKTPTGKPLNPVANFHIRNGATVSEDNINFLANTSPRGLKDSCSIMVNYIYSLDLLSSIESRLRWLGSIVRR